MTSDSQDGNGKQRCCLVSMESPVLDKGGQGGKFLVQSHTALWRAAIDQLQLTLAQVAPLSLRHTFSVLRLHAAGLWDLPSSLSFLSFIECKCTLSLNTDHTALEYTTAKHGSHSAGKKWRYRGGHENRN